MTQVRKKKDDVVVLLRRRLSRLEGKLLSLLTEGEKLNKEIRQCQLELEKVKVQPAPGKSTRKLQANVKDAVAAKGKH